jgi:hypothetical protein
VCFDTFLISGLAGGGKQLYKFSGHAKNIRIAK